jgi:pSer/pThr/pTyr-binding forkhead associated (FHA) protein
MSARIILTATAGPLEGRDFVFTTRTIGVVGRSEECLLRVSGGAGDPRVSRRHCLLNLNPPTVQVCDLGSLNGTFVNGRNIGQRPEGAPPGEMASTDAEQVELHDGDQLTVGGSTFLIGIQYSQEAAAAAEGPLRAKATTAAGLAACR